MLRRLTRRPSASAPPGESAADLVFHALCLTPVRIDYTLYDIWIDGYSGLRSPPAVHRVAHKRIPCQSTRPLRAPYTSTVWS